MSPLNYSLVEPGSKTDGAGGISGHFGLAYTWNINDYFGIVTGLELASYGAKSSYDLIKGEETFDTPPIPRHIFSYTMSNYVEEQSITFVSIPVMFQYSTPLQETMKFYVSAGVKIGLPVRAEATQFPDVIETKDYNEGGDKVTYYGPRGKGLFKDSNSGTIPCDIDHKNLSIAASLETGVRFLLTEKILLYTSAYLDCGLNNIRSVKDKDIITYQEITPSILKYASILNTPYVDSKVKIFGAGLRVRVSFGW
jgi:hypothetical protein